MVDIISIGNGHITEDWRICSIAALLAYHQVDLVMCALKMEDTIPLSEQPRQQIIWEVECGNNLDSTLHKDPTVNVVKKSRFSLYNVNKSSSSKWSRGDVSNEWSGGRSVGFQSI